eukprot:GDKJ01021211.1.p1 GENE.GDKJ01021211.1~~GDKJ01021211.1.p1  ORF type:complete len:141 (-),score=8.64 GDKJ01021211.1:33-455(-)
MSKDKVLFQKGKAEDNALWDDSELIDAWTRQLDRIRTENVEGERRGPVSIEGDRGLDEGNEGGEDEPLEFAGSDEESDRGHEEFSQSKKPLGSKRPRETTDGDLLFPPIPEGIEPSLAGLLRSWYEAGYRTGLYVASREQ